MERLYKDFSRYILDREQSECVVFSMVFSSLEFIFRFLPLFLLFYYITPNKYKNITLFICSICFYAFGEPVYVVLILFSILINYGIGRKIGKIQKRRKAWLMLALVFDIGMLGIFKYTDFLIENMNHILYLVEKQNFLPISLESIPRVDIILPLGISFYTFQIMSYVIDVYRGKVEAETSFICLGAYISMFPQLIAGPIVTYASVSGQLRERNYTLHQFESGLRYFVIGLASKVLIANRIGGVWHEIQTIGFESISTPLAWLGAFAYTFQIYFDFQGYSLMAIGLGKMIGFTLPKNFNHPYISKSMTEFWQRWHMTLAKWFKEYVYIPLGGNRGGRWKTIRNMFIVWTLTGLWHGANWNFIIWGILIFLIMCMEKAGLKKYLDRSRFFSRVYMIFLIPITWVIFAITSLSQLQIYLGRMFPFFGMQKGACINPRDYVIYLWQYGIVFILAIIGSTRLPVRWYRMNKRKMITSIILLGLFWFSVYFLATAANNPFLYFRF